MNCLIYLARKSGSPSKKTTQPPIKGEVRLLKKNNPPPYQGGLGGCKNPKDESNVRNS